MDHVTEISTYYYHSIVVQNYTTLWTFGYNAYGMLGDGTITTRYIPTNVTFSQERIRQVSCGQFHSIVLFEGGSVWGFGKFTFTQIKVIISEPWVMGHLLKDLYQ
jgi:alpha-tubulin suppressor-like RCC1 family protein